MFRQFKLPAIALLFLVYLFIIPYCLSYKNAWMHQETTTHKGLILKTGTSLNLKDIKSGLDWQLFEYVPRCTRPFSSYLEIINTKFRVWLWQYILPHPSLSITWFFSFILGPILLFKLFRNIGISANISLTMTAFYLATPGVLSCDVMMFRPAKAMTNFFIILCLFLASRINKDKPIPLKDFLYLWLATALAFYWDETALLIFPAIFFIFPYVLFKHKRYLLLWLTLPVITFINYFKLLPFLTTLAGYKQPVLSNCNLLNSALNPTLLPNSLKYLASNTQSIILDTMGIFFPHPQASLLIQIGIILAIISWLILFTYILRFSRKWDPLLIFLILLILFFNASVFSISLNTWGPYWYGTYWSIFFVLFLARTIKNANIPPYLLTACFFFIIVSTTNCFLGTNTIYKKYHWYPYSPGTIGDYFAGKRLRFDPRDKPPFTPEDIKETTRFYWKQVRKGLAINSLSLPKELCWLPFELEPQKSYTRSLPGLLTENHFKKQFTDGAEIFKWLWLKKCYIVRISKTDSFIREDIPTTITEGLKDAYPTRWQGILSIIQKAKNSGQDYFTYKSTKPSNH